jgi:hypothetical protein
LTVLRSLLLLGMVFLCSASTAAASPRIDVRALTNTDLPLGDVVWTGSQLLYVAERPGQIDLGTPSGGPLRPFVTLPREGEEVRCVPAPPGHRFPAGLYCHTAQNNVYRVTADGRIVLFARLPERRTSDGALAFDTTGHFGYELLAATGRSDDHHGGAVFAVGPRGAVTMVGSYPGPGGAENAAIAPAGFGRTSGDLLLTIDKARSEGRLLAMDSHGHVSTIATVRGDGLNPLVVLPASRSKDRSAGVAIADTHSRIAWLISAAQLHPFAGDVIVGAELRGWIFVVEPTAGGYRTLRLTTSLTGSQYNLEGATFIP